MGNAMLTQPALRHRSDIDGLRAVAIVPILLYHCGVTRLRGGVVGVDVFFVISGYLITAIVSRELATGTFGIAGFYRRRIIRILPALVMMMAVVLAVGCLVLLPGQLRELGYSTIATALFASNFHFAATTDYFAQAADALPLVHTWSLAVEEQFYLAYPIVLVMLGRCPPRRRAATIAVISTLSLMVAAWQCRTASPAAFYLLPARIWELGLGALAALGAFPKIESPRLRAVVAWSALAMIAASCVMVKAEWGFPAPWAIPPALGAAMLIAWGEDAPTARLLTALPMRAIGKISYSLYLWHRPIVALYLLERGTPRAPGEIAGLVATSVFAAVLSYRWVERPCLRRWRTSANRWPLIIAPIGLGLLALAGAAVADRADTIHPLPPAARRVAAFEGFAQTAAGQAQYYSGRCFTLSEAAPYEDATCLRLASDRPNLLLIGDSHAAQLSQALRKIFADRNVLQLTAAGCRPLWSGKGSAICRSVIGRAFDGRVDLHRIALVVLAGRWLPEELAPLAGTLDFFRGRGVTVVVVGPMVEYDIDLPLVLARAMASDDLSQVDRVRLRERLALNALVGFTARAHGAYFFSTADFECPQGHCRLFASDGSPQHIDQSHLSPGAAFDLAMALRRKLSATARPLSH
jgi:peptidoglycan/LPS O-acetylase OafA/YrhL